MANAKPLCLCDCDLRACFPSLGTDVGPSVTGSWPPHVLLLPTSQSTVNSSLAGRTSCT